MSAVHDEVATVVSDLGLFDLEIRRAPNPEEVEIREFFEAVAAYQTRLFEASAIYNQVMVLAGYAGFFATWSTLAPDIDRWVTQLAGGLIVISLTIYAGWTVIQMYSGRAHIARMLEEIGKGRVDFRSRIAAAEAKGVASAQSLMKWWKPVVWSAGLTAFAAAVLVGSAAFLAVAR